MMPASIIAGGRRGVAYRNAAVGANDAVAVRTKAQAKAGELLMETENVIHGDGCGSPGGTCLF